MSQVSPWWQLKSGMITVLELCLSSFPAWLCGSGGRNLGPGCHTKAHRAAQDKGLWLILPRMRPSLCSLTWFLPGLRNIQLTPGRRVDCFLLPQNSEGVIDCSPDGLFSAPIFHLALIPGCVLCLLLPAPGPGHCPTPIPCLAAHSRFPLASDRPGPDKGMGREWDQCRSSKPCASAVPLAGAVPGYSKSQLLPSGPYL